MIIVALRVDRDRAAFAPLEHLKRILIGPVIDAEHDDRANAPPQHPRVGAALGLRGEPVHGAMGARIEELTEMLAGMRDCIRTGDADAVEAERTGFVLERGPEIGGRERDSVQKSRST
jgi:hypothetical protein